MKNPLIICGSLSRPSLPLLKWIKDPEVIVEPQEEAMYREAHPELKYHVLPKSGGGFSFMMNQMAKIARAKGERYFIFTDDDVFGFRGRAKLADKFVRLKDEQVREELAKLIELCEKKDISQMAVSFSGQSWAAKKEYQGPCGAWGVYICDAQAVQAVGGFDENLIIFGDWEMSARLIKAGHRVFRTNLLTFEHKMKSLAGGAEHIYSQNERVQKAAHAIQTRYGAAACRIKFVPAHGIHEIRFNWKALQAPLK